MSARLRLTNGTDQPTQRILIVSGGGAPPVRDTTALNPGETREYTDLPAQAGCQVTATLANGEGAYTAPIAHLADDLNEAVLYSH